jgi:hypothetical protein
MFKKKMKNESENKTCGIEREIEPAPSSLLYY